MHDRAPNRPAVLLVGPEPPPIDGGIAAYIGGLARSPVAERFDLRIVDTRVPRLQREHRALRPFLTPRLLLRLQRATHRHAGGLVHIHTSAGASFWEKALLAGLARRRGWPVLLHLHDGHFEAFLAALSPRRRRAAAGVLRGAAGILAPCAGWRALLESFTPGERIALIPNGVDTEYFRPSGVRRDDGAVRLLFVGSLSDAKGLPELRAALCLLRQRGVRSFHVDLVGSATRHADAVRQRTAYHRDGLDDWVRFHGVDHAGSTRQWMQQADAFVLPSRVESFGIANLEAMACGLPVVSTRTGAIPEYIVHGEHGWLLQPGDVNGLADALQRLIQDAGLRQRLGAAARQRALQYDWRIVGARVACVYERVLAAAPIDTC